jgi:hypothetical protein
MWVRQSHKAREKAAEEDERLMHGWTHTPRAFGLLPGMLFSTHAKK